MHVGAVEVGVLRVLFAAVELMTSSYGSDNELAQASRFDFLPSLQTHVTMCSVCRRESLIYIRYQMVAAYH